MKLLDRLQRLIHKGRKNLSKARHKYKLTSDLNVRHTRQLIKDYMIYVDNLPTSKRRQSMTSTIEDPSVKLRPTKSNSNKVVRAAPHKMTTDVNELHSIVSIDRVTLWQAAQEINQNASETNCDNRSSTEPETLLTKPQTVEPFIEDEASTVPKNGGLLRTTTEDANRANHRAQSKTTRGEVEG